MKAGEKFLTFLFGKSIPQGAATQGLFQKREHNTQTQHTNTQTKYTNTHTHKYIVYVSTAPEIDREKFGGAYFVDCNKINPTIKAGREPEIKGNAKRLWELSLKLLKLETTTTQTETTQTQSENPKEESHNLKH